MSRYIDKFIASFGESAPEARLWIAVISKTYKDLDHKRWEVREDARSFLFNEDDDGFDNLLNMLGLNGEFGKHITKEFFK
jgi:hypothetical protein